ncbi:MAG: sigma-70 family RNA polymerase sigma factor [Actinomycetia bacterium]|nr:sigma-70 family RNA polymerase sigma factor [Actinomycetes bacterium]
MRGFGQQLARARRGDGAAMRALYDSVAAQVTGYARGNGVEDPDALANETLFRALSRIDRFEGGEQHFRSWVFTIAHNLIIDDRRRMDRRPQQTDDDGPLEFATAPDDPAHTAISNCATEELIGEIARLTDSQRDVVLLRVVADLSLEDVARITGRTVGATKAQQHRALATLRRRLADRAVSRDNNQTFTPTP